MALVDPSSLSCTHPGSIHGVRDPGWTEPAQAHHLKRNIDEETDAVQHSELSGDLAIRHTNDSDGLADPENIERRNLVQEKPPSLEGSTIPFPQLTTNYFDLPYRESLETPAAKPKRPFHKWMRSLHRNSTSGSSFGFVSAVQSASISLASASAVTRSHRNNTHSRFPSQTDHSSRASMCGPRFSEDSAAMERPVPVDAAATQRSLQRRQILEELISTEESYIGDVRFLMNVYITILVSLPTLPMRLRSSINRNLTEIVELHEEILGDLHRVIPHSEYTQIEISLPLEKPKPHGVGHRRWWSLDAVTESKTGDAWLQNIPGMVADPQVAAEVAKLFSKRMNRFFIYKEYGAKYEMMMKDVASAHQTMPQWETYQKGLEALASTLSSSKTNGRRSKKSLTIGDLLVKPIQRVCKYPLLFAELLKCTLVCDCPNSHMEVETALMRLREATAEINRATNDDHMKATLEKTWLLQDRLMFPGRRLDAASKNQIRSFGYIQLCGVLHICWQAKDAVEGQYMICLLYRNLLCLASAGKVDLVYTIQACINMTTAKVEDAGNGQGLQCHTAPFSWKLVFESDHQLYELILTACSPKEELEWRSRLSQSINQEQNTADVNIYSTLSMNIKSLGTVFGRPGTVARNISIRRTTTVRPKSLLSQVILKNTSVTSNHSRSSISINRSQSLLTTNARIPVLAPPRSERSRLETLLMDVWSRDVLPFPGMALRSRSEHLVRNSASTMMRKLSVAGITGPFGKKPSYSAQGYQGGDESEIHDGAPRRCSRSSDHVLGCGANTYPGASRLSKRPRTRGVIIKQNESAENHEELEFDKTKVPEITQTHNPANMSLASQTMEAKESSILHASIVESPRQSSSLSSEKSLTFYHTKETTVAATGGSKGHGRRWRKLSGSRQEGKGQMLRSLFR